MSIGNWIISFVKCLLKSLSPFSTHCLLALLIYKGSLPIQNMSPFPIICVASGFPYSADLNILYIKINK